ncbi:MAG: bifunctional diaminohydroxyphosphoribosylaminopyrimidine deaminase/5-amino-6-(5-phosphoribosylamino)uracil reductase RibD [Chthoniobacterales bacterium]|nr:MAG: bifunctional diaminohydroxyphosphoribosylaminopyrimidine deaminase/5-amino-6-(5-phosphoribosylamino)uracil reductase RibD [Chthoniobacterales bacterium]
MPAQSGDEKFMRAALTEAKKALGQTSPNPAVGAVLVRGERIVARGFHARAGAPHAEVDCLRRVPQTKSATLYLTLEPCSTQGRTPPCTEYIIERGIQRVVIGAADPNPRHCGHGIELLRKAGIEVSTGILERECTQLNEAFNKWIVTGKPFVIAKCAMSLDGRLTRPPGESQWLSSPAARAHARKLRAEVDAILVGAETIRSDNPRLTTGRRGQQPWRVVLTRSGRLQKSATVFQDSHRERTLVCRNQSLASVLRDLGKREVLSVLIEGGGEVLTQALDERLIDKFQIYLTPLFTGGDVLAFGGNGAASTANAVRLARPRYERIGNDVCVTGYAPDTSSRAQSSDPVARPLS